MALSCTRWARMTFASPVVMMKPVVVHLITCFIYLPPPACFLPFTHSSIHSHSFHSFIPVCRARTQRAATRRTAMMTLRQAAYMPELGTGGACIAANNSSNSWRRSNNGEARAPRPNSALHPPKPTPHPQHLGHPSVPTLPLLVVRSNRLRGARARTPNCRRCKQALPRHLVSAVLVPVLRHPPGRPPAVQRGLPNLFHHRSDSSSSILVVLAALIS